MATKQPDDRSYFILPDLGEGVHEAELIRWRAQVGQTIAEHETLAEMETDKALVEVPSPWTGTITELCGSEGDIINVGSILVRYSAGEESPVTSPTPAEAAASEVEPAASPEAAEREDDGTVVGSVSGELSMPASFMRQTAEPGTKAVATPAVRKVAKDLDVDINAVVGTGRGGRVTASDIHGFAQGATTEAAVAPAPVAPAPSADIIADPPMPLATRVAVPIEGVAERIPFRGVRRKIAEALAHSVKTAVHFTVTNEADVTALDQRRKGYQEILGRKISLLPFILAATCRALKSHPALNATVDDFVDEIQIRSDINLGIAVDTEHGLMVPVIPGSSTLSVVQLGDAVTELAQGCRDRTIDRERLTGSTFTVSNVGSYGGLFATPIINYPEVAILAAGRARETVLTRDGAFFAGRILPLSLSCDHRVVDGAEGARFLNTLVGLLESPDDFLPKV